MGVNFSTRRTLLGAYKSIYVFDLGLTTFTPAMAKRTSPGPFETAPIYQGDWDGTGTPDVVTYPRGAHLANPAYELYANADPYQTNFVFWVVPEWDGDDGLQHQFVFSDANVEVVKTAANNLQLDLDSGNLDVDVSAWTAGTLYFVSVAYDTKRTIDGTNYARISINNAHSYGITTQPTVAQPDLQQHIGSDTLSRYGADTMIGGYTRYRRILTDDNGYGANVGNTGVSDELTEIYNAGAGVDPCTVTTDNDVVVCQPTDSTAGAYASGDGEMWSHPLGSSIVDDTHMCQGRMPGGAWAIEFNGTSTQINFGSDASLDNLPNGAILTIGVMIRLDADPSGNGVILHKGNTGADGYILLYDKDNDRFEFQVELATAAAEAFSGTFVPDGKWHYVVGTYVDATKTARVNLDGYWGVADVGVGAYQLDAARDMYMSRYTTAGTGFFQGGAGWLELSDNDRHGAAAGTDFPEALPIAPYDDGNRIESWAMETGTGAVASATVAGANDGTITNGSWSNIWARELTPVEPVALEFFAENDGIDFGSGVNIDDLFLADCTIEACMRLSSGASNTYLLSKTTAAGADGWYLRIAANDIMYFVAFHAGGALELVVGGAGAFFDNIWHHFAVDWDFGTLTGRMLVDGVPVATDTAIGAYDTDAANDCLVNARGAIGTTDGSFAIGPIRLSNNRRYTGNSFAPPDMANWPGNDINAQLITTMRDGTGATVTDYSGNAYHGTVTFGATTRWLNTTDGELIEPGNRMYPHSMVILSDQADDGIVINTAPTNPSDSVLLPRISYGQDGQAWPIVDFNGSEFKLPRMQDVHTGANNNASLVNANGSFTQQIKGWEIANVTDGSAGQIAAISGDGTTLSAGLTGGTDDDWDTGDVYIIRPPGHANYCDYPIGTYGIHVLRTAAAAVDLKVKNEHGLGMMAIHLMEVQESAYNSGDMESLQNNGGTTGFEPTGATDNGLDVGDSIAEAVIIHSGAQSLEFAVGASAEGFYESNIGDIPQGSYYAAIAWGYSVNGVLTEGAIAAANGPPQYDPAANALAIMASAGAAWTPYMAVRRQASATQRMSVLASAGAGGLRYLDDLGYIPLDAITLTVTPASEANSLEGTGIRVDGLGTLTQPIPVGYLRANEGHIRFPITPRHAPATVALFGNATPYLCSIYLDATRLIEVYWSAANTVTMTFNDGGGAHTVNWDATGLLPVDTLYWGEVIYTPSWMRLYAGGTQRAEIATTINFTGIPDTAYWLTDNDGISQGDAVVG